MPSGPNKLMRLAFASLPVSWQKAARSWRHRRRTADQLHRFEQQVRSGAALKIVVGSSGVVQPGWIQTEIDYLNLLRPGDWAKYFPPASLEAILAEHVWEHLTPEEGFIAAQTCYKYLRVGGYLRVAVPDGFHSDPAYVAMVKIGGTGAGADDHKVLYDYQTFGELFSRAGFTVDFLEYFDAQGKFKATAWSPADGLVRRSQAHDARNAGGKLGYTSLILDARKLAPSAPTTPP